MNKLSILIILSIVAFAATLNYDLTIGLSDQHFWPINATVTLLLKNSLNKNVTDYLTWEIKLVSNSNQTINTEVTYFVEELTQFMFKFKSKDNPSSMQPIKLRDFYIVPKYLQNSTAISQKTIRICPPEKHQSIYPPSYVELKDYTC